MSSNRWLVWSLAMTVLLVHPGPLHAQDTKTLAGPPWITFTETERSVAYYERQLFPETAVVRVWLLFDYKSEQVSPTTNRRYFSEKAEREVDCPGERSRTLSFTWYSGQQGLGKVVYTTTNPRPWEPHPPQSIGKAISAVVCSTGTSSTQTLMRTASSMNKTLPMMVDATTELMNVRALPGVIVYNNRLINATSGPVARTLVDERRAATTNRACTTPQTRDGLLKQGISMRFAYYDKDRKYVAEFDITLDSCDSKR